MANLTIVTDVSTFPITRQTLYNMWSEATLGSIAEPDLDESVNPITQGSDFSDAPATPEPGALFFHGNENVLYVWHDEIDNTGVSLWLAAGPDKFETAMLAEEPIPFGYPVDISYDRRAVIADRDRNRPVGFNQSGIIKPEGINDGPTYGGDTTASGAWFRCGIDGLIHGVMENALSSPSQALVTIVETEYFALDPLADGRVVQAGSTAGSGQLHWNPVGFITERLITPGGTTISEPVYVFKFMFAPREWKAFDSQF